MPFCQASLAVPHRLLVLRHEGCSFISSLAFRYRKTPFAVLYRLRSITRATRFACASTPFNERPELQFELGTDCAGLPAQAFGALCPLRRRFAEASSLIYGSAIKTLLKPRKISELRISNRR